MSEALNKTLPPVDASSTASAIEKKETDDNKLMTLSKRNQEKRNQEKRNDLLALLWELLISS